MLGATVANIVTLQTKEFSVLIVSANLLAWPLAFIAMNRWLENFAFRIDPGWGIFLAGGTTVLLLAWLTLAYQTIKAGRMNPVETLRYE